MVTIERQLISFKPVFLTNPRRHSLFGGGKTYIYDIIDACANPHSYYEPFLLVEFEEKSIRPRFESTVTKVLITNGQFISLVIYDGMRIQLTNNMTPELEDIEKMLSESDIETALGK